LVQIGVAKGLLSEEKSQQLPLNHGFVSLRTFRLRLSGAKVLIGDAGENTGYGGGINRWLKPLADVQWPGVFVLNPDAAPDADALAKLKQYAEANNKGMVAGKIVFADNPDKIQTRGLRFRPWRMVTEAVGKHASSSEKPNIQELERILDAPSGAAFYVTRACIDRIGLMREDYFLYYEDLDWGRKAKKSCGIGYAFDAKVVHKGGTTIGSGGKRDGSPFSSYLEFRNRILFVRREMPLWTAWALGLSLLRAIEFLAYRRPDKAMAALHGIADGVRGRSGRPDALLIRHLRDG